MEIKFTQLFFYQFFPSDFIETVTRVNKSIVYEVPKTLKASQQKSKPKVFDTSIGF